ncbi:MAG: carotenoid biosynthesis protein, partial [Lentisphaeria bacterium]
MPPRLCPLLLTVFLLLLGGTVAAMLAGVRPPDAIVPVAAVAGFLFAVAHAGRRLGWKPAGVLLALVFVVSLAFETVGAGTGWVYGPYHYSDRLGPMFLGLVPWLIPASWFMMMYPALLVAERLLPAGWQGTRRAAGLAALAGLVMTAWDVVLDPLMVRAGFWSWEVAGPFFGVPLRNYAGWWVTSTTAFALFLAVFRRLPQRTEPR